MGAGGRSAGELSGRDTRSASSCPGASLTRNFNSPASQRAEWRAMRHPASQLESQKPNSESEQQTEMQEPIPQ